MSGTKRSRESQGPPVLLVHNASECNDEDVHAVIYPFAEGSNKALRLLLDLSQRNEQLGPDYDRGPNASAALPEYMNWRFHPAWKSGDPLSTEKEEAASDDEVRELYRNRREKAEKAFRYVVSFGFIDDDKSLVEESMTLYIDHVVELAQNPKKVDLFENKEQQMQAAQLTIQHFM